MAEIKMTKMMVLRAIMAVVEGCQDTVEIEVGSDVITVTADDMMQYCETAIAQIESKAAKAKERAGEKKAEGDELRAEVLSHITEDLQTADEITAMVTGFDDVTKSKVVARLTQLVKSGAVEKEQIKTEDGRKIMAYRLPKAE